MRKIDCAHSRTLPSFREISTYWIFASIHILFSLNQGQESIFTQLECSQSIFRMILLLYRLFWQKNFHRLVPDSYPLKKFISRLTEAILKRARELANKFIIGNFGDMECAALSYIIFSLASIKDFLNSYSF